MKRFICFFLVSICVSCFFEKKNKQSKEVSEITCPLSRLTLSKYTYPLLVDSLTISNLQNSEGSEYIKEKNNIVTINIGTSTFSFYKNEYKEFLIYSVIKDPDFTFHKDVRVGIGVDELNIKELVECDTIVLENDEYSSYTSLVLDENHDIKTIIYENFYE